MTRKITFRTLAALALLGLAVPGCTNGEDGGGGAGEQHAPAVEDPHKLSDEKSTDVDRPGAAGNAHSANSAGHGPHGSHDAHGDGSTGEGHGHRRGMDRHGGGQRQEGGELRPGEDIKDFTLNDRTGKPFRLGALRRTADSPGKIAVLTFWCTTCHSCRGIERTFDQKAREYEGQGVQFLMVDSNFTDDAQRVNQFIEENGLSFTVLMDSESEVARYFGARFTTTTAVIDAKGRLRYYGGFRAAEAAVQNLLAGVDVAVPESPGGG